jgi:hypothetical protein
LLWITTKTMQNNNFKCFRKFQCPSIPVSSWQSVPHLQKSVLVQFYAHRANGMQWHSYDFQPRNATSQYLVPFFSSHCHSVRFSSACTIAVLTDSAQHRRIHTYTLTAAGIKTACCHSDFFELTTTVGRETGLARRILRSVFRFTGVWPTLIIYAAKLATTACHTIDADRP